MTLDFAEVLSIIFALIIGSSISFSLLVSYFSKSNKKNKKILNDYLENNNDILSLNMTDYMFLSAKTSDEKFNKFLLTSLVKSYWRDRKINELSLDDEFFTKKWQKDRIGEILKEYKTKALKDENE